MFCLLMRREQRLFLNKIMWSIRKNHCFYAFRGQVAGASLFLAEEETLSIVILFTLSCGRQGFWYVHRFLSAVFFCFSQLQIATLSWPLLHFQVYAFRHWSPPFFFAICVSEARVYRKPYFVFGVFGGRQMGQCGESCLPPAFTTELPRCDFFELGVLGPLFTKRPTFSGGGGESF